MGREAEAAALLSIFEAASTGGARLVLVSGHSGIGTSFLIRTAR